MSAHQGATEHRDHYVDELGDNFTPEGMRKVRRLVGAVNAWGGTAHTSQIRDVSGLSRSSYQHFYDKLVEFDIIESDIENVDGELQKVAILTDKGQDMWNKRVFDRWLDEKRDDETPTADEKRDGEVQQLRSRVTTLENVVARLLDEVEAQD